MLSENYGVLTEQKVFAELRKRGLPCRHRVHIKGHEVDILVGERLCIEVDGYYHALRGKISQDACKQKALEDLGYVVLRITGDDAKDRHKLRQFADWVVEAYGEQQNHTRSNKSGALTKSIPQAGLGQLKARLEKEAEKQKQEQRENVGRKRVKPEKLTDEELFLQAINDLSKRGRK